MLNIYTSLTGKSLKEAEEEFKNYNYGDFKKSVAAEVVKFLEDIQEKYNKIINSDIIDEILDEGINKAITGMKSLISIDHLFDIWIGI